MLLILTYISLIAGGLLVLILLMGIVGGLDLDFDLDFEDAAESDVGMGVGLVKGGLTFLAVGAYTIKLLLLASTGPVLAVGLGAVAGAIAVYLMTFIVRWMMRFDENVNWDTKDALFRAGKVYLKIPLSGEGIVRVNLKGGTRELKARSTDGTELPTGTPIVVDDLAPDGVLLVSADGDTVTL